MLTVLVIIASFNAQISQCESGSRFCFPYHDYTHSEYLNRLESINSRREKKTHYKHVPSKPPPKTPNSFPALPAGYNARQKRPQPSISSQQPTMSQPAPNRPAITNQRNSSDDFQNLLDEIKQLNQLINLNEMLSKVR